MKNLCIIVFTLFSFNCFSQVSNIKTFNILNMEWTTENLSTDHFLNGDLIPYAGTKEEWKKAAREKKPAWCYIDDNYKTNKYGKLYNWYAVNDSRGLSISKDYIIPTTIEWQLLINHMAYLEKVNFCEGDETIFQTLDSAGKYYERKLSPIFNEKILNGYGMRREDGKFHDNEGTINGWWCTNGFAGDDFWYCSPSIYYWGVSSFLEERKGWGFRVLLFKYLKKKNE